MVRVVNKKAIFNFETGEKIEAGIVLTGGEAKSARLGQVSLGEAYIKILNSKNEDPNISGLGAVIINMHIHPYKYADNREYDSTRTRKLLLRKKELIWLQSKIKQKGLTMVPLSLVTRGAKVKLEIALARGKKQHEKRESIKKKDIQRDMERGLN